MAFAWVWESVKVLEAWFTYWFYTRRKGGERGGKGRGKDKKEGKGREWKGRKNGGKKGGNGV